MAVWAAAGLLEQAALLRGGRDREPAEQARRRRRLLPLLAAAHTAFAIALLAGVLLLRSRHWGLGHARWLAVKIGLTVFLLIPLEAMHAWIWQGWIARGLAPGRAPSSARDLERGVGMDDMLRALAAPLLAIAVPLIVWLSVRKPW